MVFSSSIFLFLFLPVTLVIYFLLVKTSFRNIWLLMASLFFYFWGEPRGIFIMLASILINYSFGMFLFFARNKPHYIRRILIVLAIVTNLSLLFWYKYLDFSIISINAIFHTAIPLKNIVLPIGISFFTFQGMTYVIDLYWNKTTVQKNPLKIALYISLFPQLIAGPIVRYVDVAEQISVRTVSIEKFYHGIVRFVVGLGKKVIIANNAALIVDQIFSLPFAENSPKSAWLGVICYTIQIYFDFSGYSDMAIGLGKMLGFDFLENFNYPYISKNITEFWRRWHISLSTFFRDYLYIPLGGNRKGNVYLNLLIVFFCTGLWHGASWNFVVWGLWHGCFILIERVLKRYKHPFKGRVFSLLGHGYTLLVVIIGWVLFRAEDLPYALGYLRIMFGLSTPVNVGYSVRYYLDAFLLFILVIAVIASLPVGPFLQKKLVGYKNTVLYKTSVPILQVFGVTMVLLISIMMVLNSSYNPFIYFRF